MSSPADRYRDWVISPTLPEEGTTPSASIVICTTPRSGSWLLCGLLASTGVAGRPHEWFIHPVEQHGREVWGTASSSEYVAHVRRAATTPNGVSALKLMWGTREGMLARIREAHPVITQPDSSSGDSSAPDERALLEVVFPAARYVWLVRQDLQAQAASWARAQQSGVWSAWGAAATGTRQPASPEPVLMRALEEFNAGWKAWFERHGIEPHIVRYEDVVEEPEAATRSVLQLLGLPQTQPQVLTAPTPTSPSDGSNPSGPSSGRACQDL